MIAGNGAELIVQLSTLFEGDVAEKKSSKLIVKCY
jgi:hypothetical protein